MQINSWQVLTSGWADGRIPDGDFILFAAALGAGWERAARSMVGMRKQGDDVRRMIRFTNTAYETQQQASADLARKLGVQL